MRSEVGGDVGKGAELGTVGDEMGRAEERKVKAVERLMAGSWMNRIERNERGLKEAETDTQEIPFTALPVNKARRHDLAVN